MNFKRESYTNDMEILVTSANLVTFSGTVLAANVLVGDEHGKKYVNAGSLIDTNGNVVTEVDTQTAAGTAGVYTLTIGTAFVNGDTVKINDTTYTAKTTPTAGSTTEFAVGSSATTQATALKVLVASIEIGFTVTNSGATIVFTQKVNGTGAIPTVTNGGTNTGAATIAQTTEGVAPTYTHALSGTPTGILYKTVDVTDGDQPGSLIVEGYVRADRVLDTYETSTITSIKAALPNVKFR